MSMTTTAAKDTKPAALGPVKAKGLYDYAPDDADCPDDIVVNAGRFPVIIAVQHLDELKKDNPRVDVGDRRRGEYYVNLMRIQPGLQILKAIKKDRARELEDIRQRRTGDKPPQWVEEARKRAQGQRPITSFNTVDEAAQAFAQAVAAQTPVASSSGRPPQ